MQSCKSVPSRSQVCRGGGEGRHRRGARTCTEGWRVRLQVGSVLRAYTLRTRVSTGYLQCTFDWLHLGPEPEAHIITTALYEVAELSSAHWAGLLYCWWHALL